MGMTSIDDSRISWIIAAFHRSLLEFLKLQLDFLYRGWISLLYSWMMTKDGNAGHFIFELYFHEYSTFGFGFGYGYKFWSG